MAEAESELPKWACPNCGKIFRAISNDSLDAKAENHLADCESATQLSDGEDQQDAKYNVTVKAPRDPDAYEMSEHFHSMYVRREDPAAGADTIQNVLQHGVIKSTHVSGRYVFDHPYDGWRWWIVVKLVDEAFYKPYKKHVAVTIYSPESESHEQVKKYV